MNNEEFVEVLYSFVKKILYFFWRMIRFFYSNIMWFGVVFNTFFLPALFFGHDQPKEVMFAYSVLIFVQHYAVGFATLGKERLSEIVILLTSFPMLPFSGMSFLGAWINLRKK